MALILAEEVFALAARGAATTGGLRGAIGTLAYVPRVAPYPWEEGRDHGLPVLLGQTGSHPEPHPVLAQLNWEKKHDAKLPKALCSPGQTGP